MSRKASNYFNVLILVILLCIIGYNLKQIATKQQEPKNERLENLNITPIPTFAISVPETTDTSSTPTPKKDLGSISTNEIRNKEVSIVIPKINLYSILGVAETISNDGQLTLTEPEDIPLWIEGWSVDIGDSGLSIIYGHRQQGINPLVFTDLDKLNLEESVEIRNTTKIYEYSVETIQVINPNQFWSKADQYDREAKRQKTNKVMLVTCTPWGSNAQRLLIILKLEAIRESTPESSDNNSGLE